MRIFKQTLTALRVPPVPACPLRTELIGIFPGPHRKDRRPENYNQRGKLGAFEI